MKIINILYDSCYCEIPSVIGNDGLSDRVFIPKDLFGRLLRQNDREGILENGFGVSLDKRKGKDIKHSPVGERGIWNLEIILFVFYEGTVSEAGVEADNLFNLRNLTFQNVSDARWHNTSFVFFNSVNPFIIFVKLVIAQFILDKKHDQYEKSYADTQSGHVDEGIPLVSFYVSVSDF